MSEELKNLQTVYGENVLMMRVDDCLIFGNKNALRSLTEKLTKSLSVEPERKWIPVSERLPINDVIVSVLDNSGDTPYRFTSVGWCTPDGQYWVVDNEMCNGVIAWMPLPEPYKGE